MEFRRSKAAVATLAAGALMVGGAVGAVSAAVILDDGDDLPTAEELAAIVAEDTSDGQHDHLHDHAISLNEYGSAVAAEVDCMLDAGAHLLGPVPTTDGTQLIYDYAPALLLSGELSDEAEVDAAYEAVDVAYDDCYAEHTSEISRIWVAQDAQGDRQALLDGRSSYLACLADNGIEPEDTTDPGVFAALAEADPSHSAHADCREGLLSSFTTP